MSYDVRVPIPIIQMEVGSIVIPKEDPQGIHWLRSGCEAYDYAICCSVEPFVMISGEGDMMWSCAKLENYRALGLAPPKYRKAAFARYKRERGVEPVCE